MRTVVWHAALYVLECSIIIAIMHAQFYITSCIMWLVPSAFARELVSRLVALAFITARKKHAYYRIASCCKLAHTWTILTPKYCSSWITWPPHVATFKLIFWSNFASPPFSSGLLQYSLASYSYCYQTQWVAFSNIQVQCCKKNATFFSKVK